MRKLFAVLGTLLLAASFAVAGPGEPVRDVTTAVDTDPAILFWFVGDDTTGVVTVEVAAGGDITLKQAGAVDTTIECPLSGAYGGVIDVSDAACDTLGEIVDIVNSTSGSEWRAALVASLASDSSNDTLLLTAAAEARGPGKAIYFDSSSQLTAQVVLIPGLFDSGNVTSDFFGTGTSNQNIIENPFESQRLWLDYASENITSSGTIVNFVATCVVPKYYNGIYSETTSTVYLEAGAATTATGKIDEFNYANGGLPCDDGKILLRITTDTDLTAQTLFATGRSEQK